MSNKSRDQLIASVTALIDAAIALGREQERDVLREMWERLASPQPRQQEIFPKIERPKELSPQKRGAQERAGHGVIKDAVFKAILAHPDDGITRPNIVRYCATQLHVIVKPGSLKNAIRLLREDGDIRNNEHGRWFPTGKRAS